MYKLFKKISNTAGLLPGELVYVGDKREEKVKISVIDYDQNNFQEKEFYAVEEVFSFKDSATVTWINIDGLHKVDVIGKIGAHFEIHPLTLEDIVNTGQRPKYEDFEGYICVILKMLRFDDVKQQIDFEQVSIILGSNFVISIQEKEGDVFGPIRERIRGAKGRTRKTGPDYLAYCLLDAVVDNYFAVLEKIGDKIEVMEEALLADPVPRTAQKIHSLKRDIIFLRKSIWPLREAAAGMDRGESKLIKKSTRIFLRDVYDHTIQIIETVETFRDIVSGMLEIYLSSISNRMNEIMKILTIVAVIFIPLTFIAGIYGMNFKYMPELTWRYGYLFALGLMFSTAAIMLMYFKKKKWL